MYCGNKQAANGKQRLLMVSLRGEGNGSILNLDGPPFMWERAAGSREIFSALHHHARMSASPGNQASMLLLFIGHALPCQFGGKNKACFHPGREYHKDIIDVQ